MIRTMREEGGAGMIKKMRRKTAITRMGRMGMMMKFTNKKMMIMVGLMRMMMTMMVKARTNGTMFSLI